MEFPRIQQTVIDAVDVREVAEFYRELFGLRYREGDEPPADGPDELQWLVLTEVDGTRQLAFQQVERLTPTTWPEHDVPMQLHLDCTVPDVDELERQRERAEALGARVVLDRTDDPQDPRARRAAPAGHPFCVFVSAE